MDQPMEHVFDGLVSTNERLMAEMTQFLESIGGRPPPGPGGVDAERPGSPSSSPKGESTSSSETLSAPAPAAPAAPPGEGSETKGERRSSRNLIPIDEAHPSGERDGIDGTGSQSSDDDSVVILAKRMDEASIISDITAPPETPFPAIMPPPKNITAGTKGKKLGQRVRPAPPPPPQRAALPPPGPPQRPLGPETATTDAPSREGGRGAPAVAMDAPAESRPVRRARKKKNRHRSSSPKGASANEGGKPVCRGSKKKNGRRPSSPRGVSRSKSNGRRRPIPPIDALDERGRVIKHREICAEDPMPGASAYLGGGNATTAGNKGNATTGNKAAAKSKGGSHSRLGKMGRKKRPPKAEGGDSDEEMQGIGFNTRIHATPRGDAKQAAAAERDPEGTRPGGTTPPPRPHLTATTTPPRPRPGGTTCPPPPRPGGMAPSPRLRTGSTACPPPEARIGTDRRRRGPEDDGSRDESGGSVDDGSSRDGSDGSADDGSAYDSDDQTQIFYESTDDEFSSGEEEMPAVGTSVADAVRGLNNRRVTTKVRNLLRIR